MKKLIFLPLVLAISACGSDSDHSNTQPPVEPIPPIYSNIDIEVETNESFSGKMTVYLGRHRKCETYPQYCGKDGKNLITPDDDKYIITVRADDLKRKYPESINSQLFAEGHYSALDILRYIGDARDDINFELGEFNNDIGSYDFTVSWDRNGDGKFDEKDNIDGEANLNSRDWYARFMYSEGESLREGNQATLEVLYERLDEFLVRDNLTLRFESFSPAMTERRQQIQKQQVERFTQYGGAIVPEIVVDFDDGAGPVTVAKDIVAKPYNMRTDIYKPGSYTVMDLLMSAHDSGQVAIDFNFWPTLSTSANVGSYAVTGINGQRGQGLTGWTSRIGEKETFDDFFDPIPLERGPGIIENIINSGTKHCSWLVEDERHTTESATLCYEEWGNLFGGPHIHVMKDVWVSRYPPSTLKFIWLNKMPFTWNPTEQNVAGDSKYPVYDIEQAIAPLDETHFGWKVADCGMCHSIDNIHLEGDSPALPDSAEPYFCASCHGNNGATAGHGENSHCFWCHSKDLKMVNHGDASINRTFGDVACIELNTGEADPSKKGPCSTTSNYQQVLPYPILLPHDQAGNYENKFPDVKFSDKLTTLGNSDWHTSQSFPDPYSCVTCHVNK
ncbi:hypothetical protein ACVBIL_12485 [Shewanella sp. 125m-7]